MLVPTSDESEVERPDEPWKYPYVAAVLDFGSNFRVRVVKDSGAAVGHRIVPEVYVNHTDPGVLGFLDEFCENHGLQPRVRERDQNYRLEVSRRDDLRDLLRLVRPYVLARDETVRLILDRLIPGLERGDHGDEQGFLKLMATVDEIREQTTTRSEPKYTEAYFREEWGL